MGNLKWRGKLSILIQTIMFISCLYSSNMHPSIHVLKLYIQVTMGRLSEFSSTRTSKASLQQYLYSYYVFIYVQRNQRKCCYSKTCITLHDPNSLPTYIYTRTHTWKKMPSSSEKQGKKQDRTRLVTSSGSQDVNDPVLLHLIQQHVEELY